jgi:hypothetical protein
MFSRRKTNREELIEARERLVAQIERVGPIRTVTHTQDGTYMPDPTAQRDQLAALNATLTQIEECIANLGEDDA